MIVRTAISSDMSAVLGLIRQLAEYEKAQEQVELTVEQLQEDGFTNEFFKCLVVEEQNEVVGMALYYDRYSTWKGRTIYLEDLVVDEGKRNQGIGKMLFEELLKICKVEQVKRFEWQVLDWNEPAINFYKKYETKFDNEWVNCQLTYSQIQAQ